MKFIKGMDLSTYWELERLGAKYYENDKKADLLTIMKDHNVDTIRLRIWNDPYSPNGESYGAGENSVENTLYIAKKVTQAGFGVLMNFHYSDFWADPGKQIKPKAWKNFGVPELEKAVFDFTYETTKRFLDEGVNVTMVQVGNELSNGLLWPQGKWPNFENMARFVDAGIRAVRKADSERTQKLFDNEGNEIKKIPVMIHLDNGGKNSLYREWFDNFTKNTTEDFEIIGLSYYPFWHGSLQTLQDNMNDVAVRYGKDLIIAEVSMGFSMEDYRSREGTTPKTAKGYATKKELVEKIEYPMTKEGQKDFTADFLDRISHIKNNAGKGFFWWEPAWIPTKGSGWATPASLAYMNDPGPGGNEWANQALFDYDGNVLPALDYIRDFGK